MIRRLLIGASALLVLAAAFVASIFLVSEIAGEVVVVKTVEEDGSVRSTRLWVADDAGYAWLRAGLGPVPWVDQARAAGRLTMVRNGQENVYRVTVLDDPESRDRVHAMMRRKYGIFDRYIDLIRDGSRSAAVRLESAEK